MSPHASLSGLVVALACAACSRVETVSAVAGAPASRRLVVGFSQIGAESGWRVAETTSMKIEAQKRGIELKLSDAQGKQENQIQALHSFLLQKVDAVILAPEKEQGFEPALRELAAARIPVVLVDRGLACDPALYATLIASDFVEEGRRAARWLIENTQGEVRIVELEGTAGSAPAIDRKQGFDTQIAREPRLQIARSQCAQFNLLKGKEVMEAILHHESQTIGAVFAHNDDMALGAVQALEESGRKTGDHLLVVSIDGTRPALEALAAGRLSAVVECNPLLGPLAFDAVESVLRGDALEKRVVVKDAFFDRQNAGSELPNRRY